MYLEIRHQGVLEAFPYLFGLINKDSLSVRYFDLCQDMKGLRRQIEDDATKAKESKKQELDYRLGRYNSA